jgi:hypothetical protein
MALWYSVGHILYINKSCRSGGMIMNKVINELAVEELVKERVKKITRPEIKTDYKDTIPGDPDFHIPTVKPVVQELVIEVQNVCRCCICNDVRKYYLYENGKRKYEVTAVKAKQYKEVGMKTISRRIPGIDV